MTVYVIMEMTDQGESRSRPMKVCATEDLAEQQMVLLILAAGSGSDALYYAVPVDYEPEPLTPACGSRPN